jgi:hypothetical protein
MDDRVVDRSVNVWGLLCLVLRVTDYTQALEFDRMDDAFRQWIHRMDGPAADAVGSRGAYWRYPCHA